MYRQSFVTKNLTMWECRCLCCVRIIPKSHPKVGFWGGFLVLWVYRDYERGSLERKSVCVSVSKFHWNANQSACQWETLIGTQINLRVCELLSLARKSICVSVSKSHWHANQSACPWASFIGTQINLRVHEQGSLERKSICESVSNSHWNANQSASQWATLIDA